MSDKGIKSKKEFSSLTPYKLRISKAKMVVMLDFGSNKILLPFNADKFFRTPFLLL
jgi:hypothetical protein